ncbi:MAG: tetratricopeptide repeat protein [Armatimonadota bacterium]|nr:tetratricopeptide repeat protein [Armatimonadota bacterium]
MQNRYLIILFLLTITLVVFLQVKNHEFLNYDDDVYITANHHVRNGLTLESIKWAFTTTYANNWHPLTWISHLLDVQLYKLKPAGHHVTSLLIHMLNVALLFVVLEMMTHSRWRSAFVAALFAIHPLHVESVAWVAERKDVLSSFFWILTLFAYLRYVKYPRATTYVPVVLIYALGLMSKPMLVTLPFVLLLLDYWPLGRTTFAHEQLAGSIEKHSIGRLVIEKIPLLVLAGASCTMTYIAQGEAVAPFERFPFGIRAANAVVAFVSYILKMLWPANLSVFYVHPSTSLPTWQVLGAGVVLICIFVLALRNIFTYPYILVGWLWYFGTLIPVIGLIQVGAQAMADRYTYMPLTGIFIIIAWGVPKLLGNSRIGVEKGKRKKEAFVPKSFILPFAALLVIISLMISAWYRTSVWKNSITLFENALRSNPNNYLAHNNLGVALEKANKLEEAAAHYEVTLRLKPNHPQAHNNLANIYFRTGKVDKAILEYRKALELKPKDAAIHNNLGVALAEKGMLDEAIKEYKIALQIRPDYDKAHLNLGMALARLGKFREAADEMNKARNISPESSEGHNNYGVILAGQGKILEAIEQFKEALRLKPENAEAHKNLAVAYYLTGKYADAWREVQLYRKYGGTPHPGLIQALKQKMPQPPK